MDCPHNLIITITPLQNGYALLMEKTCDEGEPPLPRYFPTLKEAVKDLTKYLTIVAEMDDLFKGNPADANPAKHHS